MSGIGFTCDQCPLQLPDAFDLSSVTTQANGYGNAAARLWSIYPGTGLLSAKDIDGIYIDENIQNTFTLNNTSYNLIEMLFISGQNKVFKWGNAAYSAAPFEVYIFFQKGTQTIALVLPIGIGSVETNASKYFNSIKNVAGSTPLPLSTLFQDL